MGFNEQRFKETISSRLEKAVGKVDTKDTEHLQKRLYRMIEYAIERFDYYEDMRARFLRIGLAYIALTAGAGVFLTRMVDGVPKGTLWSGGISVCLLLLTGLDLVRTYWKTTVASYPHRRFLDVRSWYFIYPLPNDLEVLLDNDPEVASRQISNAGDAFIDSVEGWIEYAKKDNGFIQEDLQQVFALHFLQKTRRDSLKRMKRSLFYGTSLVVASLIAAAGFSISETFGSFGIGCGVILMIYVYASKQLT